MKASPLLNLALGALLCAAPLVSFASASGAEAEKATAVDKLSKAEESVKADMKDLGEQVDEQLKILGKQTEDQLKDAPKEMAKSFDKSVNDAVSDVNKAATKESKGKKGLPIE